MECQITLSNGKMIQEQANNDSWWRSVLEYCRVNKLTIKNIMVNGEVLPQKCDAYFMIHDVLAICGGPTFIRKGYGLIRRDDKKARIIWFLQDKRLFDEIQKPYPDFYEEICVEREKMLPR